MRRIGTIIILLLALVIPIVLATHNSDGFDGNDDGFNTHARTSGGLAGITVTCTMNFTSTNNGGTTIIGSFDSPNDTATSKYPIRMHIGYNKGLADTGSGICTYLVYPNESCSGTPVINITRTVTNTLQKETITNTTALIGHSGELCTSIIRFADNSISTLTTRHNGTIGIAPLLNNSSVYFPKLTYKEQQQLTYNLNNYDDIQMVWSRLILRTNGTIVSNILSSTNLVSYDMFSLNSLLHYFYDVNLSYSHVTWTDNGKNHSRFSTSTTNSTNFTMFNQTNFTAGNFAFVTNETTNQADLYYHGTYIGTFSMTFYERSILGELTNINLGLVLQNHSQNLTWKVNHGTWSGTNWVYKQGDPNAGSEYFKWGSNFTSIIPKNVSIRYEYILAPYVTLTKDQGHKIVYASIPNATYPFAFNYYDLPESVEPDLTGFWANYTQVTNILIDPEASENCVGDGATDPFDDGFHDNCMKSSTDNLLTHTCRIGFLDFQNTTGPRMGSFNDPDDPDTTRVPLSINVTSTINLATTGNNTCQVEVQQTESCASTSIMNFYVNNNNNLLSQPTLFMINQSTGWDGFSGEHCVRLTACSDDGITARACTSTTGKIGTAPYLSSINVSVPRLNFFQDQTLNHNIESGEDSDISNLKMTIVNASNDALLEGEDTDGSTSTAYVDQMVNFDTNPTPNFNITYNYTSWTDSSSTYNRFSTSSLNSINGYGPKPSSFNISNILACTGLQSVDGISIFNLGEFPDRAGIILDVNGNPYTVTSAKNDHIHYRVSGSDTDQVVSASFDVNSTGGWRINNRELSSTVQSAFSLLGLAYDIFFQSHADGDSAEENNCNYSNAFNTSSLLQVSTLSGSINNLTDVNVTPHRYNRFENVNNTMFIFKARGSLHTSQSSINVSFMDNASLIQVSSGTESTNSLGFLDTNLQIPTTATGINQWFGTPYFTRIRDSNHNYVSFNNSWNGTDPVGGNTFNVSSWYLLNNRPERDSTRDSVDSIDEFPNNDDTGEINAIEGYKTVYDWAEVRNTRNENISGRTVSFTIKDSTGATFTTTTRTTGADSWTTSAVQVNSQTPVGQWNFSKTVSSNGNTGFDYELVDFQEGGADPLTLLCNDVVYTQQNITCTLKLTYLNGSTISGQTPQLNYTMPNGTPILITMSEISTTGNYRARFNATIQGTYDILANNTFGGYNYQGTYTVMAENTPSGGSGSGGLDSAQNATLYAILSWLQSNLSVNTTHINSGINTILNYEANSTSGGLTDAQNYTINRTLDYVANISTRVDGLDTKLTNTNASLWIKTNETNTSVYNKIISEHTITRTYLVNGSVNVSIAGNVSIDPNLIWGAASPEIGLSWTQFFDKWKIF